MRRTGSGDPTIRPSVTDNGSVRSHPARAVAALVTAGIGLAGAGCTGQPPGVDDGSEAQPVGQLDARVRLAGLVAAAKDRRFVAGYALSQPGRATRTVTVTIATDGSWRIDVPGGALGGQADIAVAGSNYGLYQCRLGADPAAMASGCVRAAPADGVLPSAVDPRVQHPFVDWLDVLTDRKAALSVAGAAPLAGSRGTCFSVEPTAAALVAPIDAGVYCYDSDGTPTAVRAGFGLLVLATAVSAGPPTAALPGPVVPGPALPVTAPPPVVTPSVTASPRPSASARR